MKYKFHLQSAGDRSESADGRVIEIADFPIQAFADVAFGLAVAIDSRGAISLIRTNEISLRGPSPITANSF